mmetsp:Transcript_120796/g.352849  ORF Transcript_120796/g.352849 Transcript_120796/m.352849 type:complete len:242 (+) Transcript_120796:77-802(+)
MSLEKPYLPLPGAEASFEEWASAHPLKDLPPLPSRTVGYWTEPWCGIVTVSGISALLISLTTGSVDAEVTVDQSVCGLLVTAIWSWAGIALICTAYIIFGRAGEIRRCPAACYPIPGEVAQRLVSLQSLEGLQNVNGPEGRTYCVRCLVWRPPPKVAGRSHHCNICQRCVTGFDHHCGVFGRCIVDGNMPCFYLVMAMFFLGTVTSIGALMVSSGPPAVSRYSHTTVGPEIATSTTVLWVN